ncbi:MAG: zinc-binding dehydrogenase [Chlorobi bacterium]|nr:zinc-binding dehydrogenase [Chlorobiota bacterium]
MRAAVLPEPGKPLVVKEVPVPEPAPTQMLIKVLYASVNHRDVWIQKGLYPGIRPGVILGSDCAGIVEKVGSEVDSSWIGKKVIVNPGLEWGPHREVQSSSFHILGNPTDGTFAEYVVVPAENVYQPPMHLSDEESAALPLAGVTAYRALFYRGKIGNGEMVLITGIGGGVALMTLKMATTIAGNIIVTSSSREKINKALELGASEGYLYTDDDWHKRLVKKWGGVDVVVDGASGPNIPKIIDILNPAGRLVIYGQTAGEIPQLSTAKLFWRHLNILGSTMGSPSDFEEMLELWNEHKLKPVIDRLYSLEEINEAFEWMDNAKQFGKIIIKI